MQLFIVTEEEGAPASRTVKARAFFVEEREKANDFDNVPFISETDVASYRLQSTTRQPPSATAGSSLAEACLVFRTQ